MTDREKLVALTMCHCSIITSGACPKTSNGKCTILDCATCLADHLIDNGVTFATDNNDGRKWIPVTERLPENEGVVLVYGSRGGIYTAEFRVFGEYHHWHKLNSKSHYCKPTHWMPLPEPPKEAE